MYFYILSLLDEWVRQWYSYDTVEAHAEQSISLEDVVTKLGMILKNGLRYIRA